MQKEMNFDKTVSAFFEDINALLNKNLGALNKRSCKVLCNETMIKAIHANMLRSAMIAVNPKQFTKESVMRKRGLFMTVDGFLPIVKDKNGICRFDKSKTKMFDIYQEFIRTLQVYYGDVKVSEKFAAKYQVLVLYRNWKALQKPLTKLRSFVCMRLPLDFFAVKERVR
ncbi:MAG: hypothetical protein KBS86_02750 [Proteobacteria bacterium]|nr:hypothetical protein [Candidatus Enterousia scatequi]